MTYAHVQVYLYRPFLHYAVNSLDNQDLTVRDTSDLAMTSVRASENIIALCEGMNEQGLLKGGLWPVTHMLTSSILTILYFVVAYRGSHETDLLFGSLSSGLQMLRCLAKHNYVAARGKVMLTVSIRSPKRPLFMQTINVHFEDFDIHSPGSSAKYQRTAS